jgi:hypothetical protein
MAKWEGRNFRLDGAIQWGICVPPLEAGRIGAEQVADITEYRGKNFIASLINDTCPGKLIYYNISGKVF